MMLGNNATYNIPAIVSQFCFNRSVKAVEFMTHPTKLNHVLLNKQESAGCAVTCSILIG